MSARQFGRHVAVDSVGFTMLRRYRTSTLWLGPVGLEWTWPMMLPLRLRWCSDWRPE